MSANKYFKSEKIRQLKEKIAKNEAAIARILSHSDAKLTCCLCSSSKIDLVYCTSCHTVPVCKLHYRNCPRTKKCPKCQQTSLTRRWSIPVPK